MLCNSDLRKQQHLLQSHAVEIWAFLPVSGVDFTLFEEPPTTSDGVNNIFPQENGTDHPELKAVQQCASGPLSNVDNGTLAYVFSVDRIET
jgi:hypothetical protein